MILRQECIGQKVRVTAPNGVRLNLIINEGEKDLYHKLGLDVFEKDPAKPKAKVSEFEITSFGIEVREPVKKDKKNGRSASSKGNK